MYVEKKHYLWIIMSSVVCHTYSKRMIDKVLLVISSIIYLSVVVACNHSNHQGVDDLNARSYAFHYRDLDSTLKYANKAYALSKGYDDGRAEALNNLAFVSMARMDYSRAAQYLEKAQDATDNQVELLIADVQLMRLCQRQSKNKDFYKYRERASRRLKRINEEVATLTARQQMRVAYAQSEFAIVESTYFYYVGLSAPSVKAMARIDPNGIVSKDTAQLLSYYYNVGSGGIIIRGTEEEIGQTEFDYLMRCYIMSRENNYPYWEANSMQAISEHLESPQMAQRLINSNLPAIKYLNVDQMPDSLLAGNLAQRALVLFQRYGDVYQTAGAYRTLAECYWGQKDYRSAIICLNNALNSNTVIKHAPDLVASIREQLSLAFSAIDDKPQSDYNRNIYLDIQEMTRQDRLLEARAAQLDQSSQVLNLMIVAVLVMIALIMILLVLFSRMRKRKDQELSTENLFAPLEQWNRQSEQQLVNQQDKLEEVEEEIQMMRFRILDNRKRNIEKRAKIALVNSITPLIDRISNEVQRLTTTSEDDDIRQRRLTYISELTSQINAYNDKLTEWIQLKQGQLNLHIESFKLQELFDLLKKGGMSFAMKGITLEVEDSDCVVKADKTLTLFMLNTLTDNARKFTPKGGKVCVSSHATPDYVEISIADTGVGMDEEHVTHIFDHKHLLDEKRIEKSEKSHCFGLMNCKGIIDKYRKVSQIFNVCSLNVSSEVGKGSVFSFRLPKGIARLLVFAFLMLVPDAVNAGNRNLSVALQYSDSVYDSNIRGTYNRTLVYAQKCIDALNHFYLSKKMGTQYQMKLYDTGDTPAELIWFEDGLRTNYDVILRVRNESAVAALALHQWNLYHYNNKAYTQLFRKRSADRNLGNYVTLMQRSETNKNVAIAILIILLLSILPAYYFVYYRHRLYYRFCVEKVHQINEVLLSDRLPEEKLALINKLWKGLNHPLHPRYTELNRLVNQVQMSLSQSIKHTEEAENRLELAEDELNRTNYESARLYVSNSVLDNCLSTLKHETMYYPSRIRQLIDDKGDLQVIKEVVDYYKELYMLLSMQAMRQIDGNVTIDDDILKYLLEHLRKLTGASELQLSSRERDSAYNIVTVTIPQLELSEQQCSELFTPSSVNVEYMICRQIVREIGESTNARASGIQARRDTVNGGIAIDIVLPKMIAEKLK